MKRAGRPFLAGLLVSTLLACSDPEPPIAPLAGEPLVEALRDGGYVLYLRHTETTRGGADDLATLGDCSAQRPLSDTGRQDARELGAAVRTLGVPVGDVLASPFCRTVETAELAFGAAETDDRLLALAPSGSDRAPDPEPLRRLLSMSPPDGTNTVLVGHVSNVGLVSDVEPEEGGTVVFRPDGDDFVLAGQVPPQGWQALAR